METPEQCVKSVQSKQDTRTMPLTCHITANSAFLNTQVKSLINNRLPPPSPLYLLFWSRMSEVAFLSVI